MREYRNDTLSIIFIIGGITMNNRPRLHYRLMKERTRRTIRELEKGYDDINEYASIVNLSVPVHKRFIIEQAFSLRGAAK